MRSTRLKSETFSTRQFFGTSEREKKLFRVPKYIQYNAEPKPGSSFDAGMEKWSTEQFSNRNFTRIASIPNLKSVFSSIQRNRSYHATTILQGFNLPGLRKEHAQSTINTMADGKCIQYKPCIIILCTIFRIAVLDRIETSLRSGKSANLHIDSFSNQWDKSQLLQDGYLLGNMLHCLTLITGSTLRQDFYQRTLFLEVIDEIRENIYSTCKHLAFTQYNARKKWTFRRVNLTTQPTPTRTSHRQLSGTSKQQASLLDNTSNIPPHESWQEFSSAPHPITPETFHRIPSISRLLDKDLIFDSEIARLFKHTRPTQQLQYRQFHVASSTLSRVAAIKHIYFHITNNSHPTAASMMTAYYSYCAFPDPTFHKLAQYYLNVDPGLVWQPQKSCTPKQHLYNVLFAILWEIEDLATFFLTALQLEPTDSPYPHLTLEHPTHITCSAPQPQSTTQSEAQTRPTPIGSATTRLNPMALAWTPSGSIPIAPAFATPAASTQTLSTPRTSNPFTSANLTKSRYTAQAFCTPTLDTQRILKEILPPDTWLAVEGSTVSNFLFFFC